MATPARDIVTKQIALSVLPSPRSTIVDLQADPRGGYWALVNVPAFDNDAEPAFLLKFDDAHNLLATHAFSVSSPDDDGYDAINVAAMSVGMQGIFVVGTSSYLHHPGLPSRVFVARFTIDGHLDGVSVYEPLLFDGCKVPQPVNCRGVGIVRLAPPNDDQMMVLFQTAIAFDGTGAPPGDDSIAAAVFTIDDAGHVRTTGVRRIFGDGQVMPSRLRNLTNIGPVIVGKTRAAGPTPSPWVGYIAWLDAVGNVVNDSPYAVGDARSVVLNDIAEGEYAIVAVGTLLTPDSTLRAVAMRVEATGNVDWTGTYEPPPGMTELFNTELNVVMTNGDVWIAGGALGTSGVAPQPWLVRLTSASPALVWQKFYDSRRAVAQHSAFQALLHNVPNRVIAGGDLSHTSSGTSDAIPFLAVSETAPGVASPTCSWETAATVDTPEGKNLASTFWIDRMPLLSNPWDRSEEERQVAAETLCSGDQQPTKK